jgi:broad specificity phosphatase PhoE
MKSPSHATVTLELAEKESAEQMQGMSELNEAMRQRPMRIKPYTLDYDKTLVSSSSTIKTVHFVRHGQAFHNLLADMAREQGREWEQFSQSSSNPYTTPEILDAPLTDKGRQQAILLQPTVRALSYQPQLVVMSANCRALQTGLLVFEHLLVSSSSSVDQTNRVVPFVAHEMAREQTGAHICDKRRPRMQQAREFPQVDFSLLGFDEDPIYQSSVRESQAELGGRIYSFFEWLVDRPEDHVAVVSHSGWLLAAFNGVFSECSDEKLKDWFQTGELRSVVLEFVRDNP